MKKRLLAVLLSVAILISLTACAGNAQQNPASEKPSESPSEVPSVSPSESAAESTPPADTIDVSGVKLMQDGTLSIGVEIGYPPFEDFAEDGTTPVGYDIDFANALGEKLGLKVNFINTAWDGIFQGIGVNYDCVISAVTINEERKQTMLFSDPYINNFQAVVVRSDYAKEIKGFMDLNGLSVAVQKETTSDKLISNYKKTASITVTITPNEKVTTCFTQLANGEVDAVLVDSTVAVAYLASDPDTYKLAYQDESEPEQFGVAMGLDNTALQTAINEAIAQLTEEGFFKQNTEHWFGS